MLDYFDYLYVKIPLYGHLLRGIRYFIRIFANLYARYLMVGENINNTITNDTLIVSLTSYPARIKNVWMVVKTLLNQKEVNDLAIILWLSREQFPDGVKSLPNNLKRLCSNGLIIRFVDDDLKSHKKYFYAFKEFPNNVVITVDDDVLYPSNLIYTLFTAHKRFTDCVICNRGAVIRKDFPYKEWGQVENYMTPQDNILPTGIGGVLYPPKSYNEAIFSVDTIKQTCINGDDLWLNFMCRIVGTKIVHTKEKFGFITIFSSQKSALSISNIECDKNDQQISYISKWARHIFDVDFFVGIK